jgi:RNA polymerase sigma-70 factor (ECF subfamily)
MVMSGQDAAHPPEGSGIQAAFRLNPCHPPWHQVGDPRVSEPAELDPERFAADDRFVRALLRRFVADPNAVDDLAQETWLAVLRQAATGGFLGRAWLSTVARNFALQSMRGDQRRLSREASVARADSFEPDGELPCDAEMRRRMLAAVESLDERYRSVVRLRFFDDLMPCEIADRLELPVETVRTRLKRGLAHVRRALTRRRA